MKKINRKILIGLLFVTFNGYANKYPDKPIELIIPYAAGSTTDSAARFFISTMKEKLNSEIVPINNPGAGAMIGLNKLVKSKNDGYTLAFSPVGAIVAQPQLRKTPYKPDSFQLICLVIDNPAAIFVDPNSNINSLPELVERSKKQKVVAAGATPGALHHLIQAYIAKTYKTKFTYLTVGGGGKAAKSILSGEADFVAETTLSGSLYGLKPLVIFSEKRFPGYPDTPTFKEMGHDIDMISARWGLFAPKNLDKSVLERLSTSCEETVNDTAFIQKMDNAGFSLNYIPSSQSQSFLDNEYNKYKYVLKEIGMIK